MKTQLEQARRTSADITRKGLIDKNIVEQSYHPSSLIAEGVELSSLLNESLLGIDEEGVGALVKNIRYIKEGVGGSSIVEKRKAKAAGAFLRVVFSPFFNSSSPSMAL